jgi:hypothetical protein
MQPVVVLHIERGKKGKKTGKVNAHGPYATAFEAMMMEGGPLPGADDCGCDKAIIHLVLPPGAAIVPVERDPAVVVKSNGRTVH